AVRLRTRSANRTHRRIRRESRGALRAAIRRRRTPCSRSEEALQPRAEDRPQAPEKSPSCSFLVVPRASLFNSIQRSRLIILQTRRSLGDDIFGVNAASSRSPPPAVAHSRPRSFASSPSPSLLPASPRLSSPRPASLLRFSLSSAARSLICLPRDV